jgi:hypothetical protein
VVTAEHFWQKVLGSITLGSVKNLMMFRFKMIPVSISLPKQNNSGTNDHWNHVKTKHHEIFNRANSNFLLIGKTARNNQALDGKFQCLITMDHCLN